MAYGTLTACGLSAAALISVLLFDESLTLVQVAGLVVLAVGVVARNRGRAGVQS